MQAYFNFCYPWTLLAIPLWWGLLVALLVHFEFGGNYRELIRREGSSCIPIGIFSFVLSIGIAAVFPLLPFLLLIALPAAAVFCGANWVLNHVQLRRPNDD